MRNLDSVRRRDYLKTVGAGAAATGLAGCVGDDFLGGDDDGDGDGDGEIVIGHAGGQSAPPESLYGPLVESGMEFAINRINDDDGVLDGRELTIASEDNESDPGQVVNAMERLYDDDAVAIIGPIISDNAIRGREEAEDLEVPYFPVQAASPGLLTKDSRYTFRTTGMPAPYYAGATGQFVEDLGVSSYGAIFAEYSYGFSYEAGIQEFITGREGLDTYVEGAAVDAEDFGSQLRAMPEDLEYMDVGGHPVGIFDIIPQMWELGLEPEAVSGPGDPFASFHDVLGDDIDRGLVQIHTVDPTSDEYSDVAQDFYDETGEYFDPFVAFGYVITNFIAEAIEEAGEADREAIRDAVSDMSYESMLAYPLEFNEWGELTEGRLVAMEFTTESPPYYPDGDFHVEELFTSDPFDPIDPEEWE